MFISLNHWFVFCCIINTGPSRESSSWIYCCCPLQWRFCSFRFARLGVVDDRMSQLIAVSGSGCWTGQPPALLHRQYRGELFSTDPARSPFVASKRESSDFFSSPVLGFNLPTPTPPGSALLCYLVNV